MQKSLYLLLFTLFLSACSYKNQAINLQPYEVNYTQDTPKHKSSIYIKTIKDQRADKTTIGYTIKDGKKDIALFSDENFEKKYKDALLSTFHSADFDTNVDILDADLVVEIYIEKIELIYTDVSFDKNLQGEINIKVIVQNGTKIITQNFKEKAHKYLANSYNSKDIEPFLSTLFSDNINSIVAKLSKI